MDNQKRLIDKTANAIEELQNSINTCILLSHSLNEDYAQRLNKIREDIFRLSNDFENQYKVSLDYMIGFATVKELEEYGR